MKTLALGLHSGPPSHLHSTQGMSMDKTHTHTHTHTDAHSSINHMMLTHRLPHPFNLGLSVVYKARSFSVSIISKIANK